MEECMSQKYKLTELPLLMGESGWEMSCWNQKTPPTRHTWLRIKSTSMMPR
ncbi:Uncharacterized protein DAT39_008048 [Clarias magur]|uniref:Uncharacterized protein n=1 Tax=Clarias magur TaxID=1594786 RepID=A0A8J4X2R5_CLAMG|nr:Uncharacterized protein DAT39_008048 [Clarias magur]